MVELNRNPLALPVPAPAPFASMLLEAFLDQAFLEAIRANLASNHEQFR
jgi:hypothetical protein